jgi:hypothetical protein
MSHRVYVQKVTGRKGIVEVDGVESEVEAIVYAKAQIPGCARALTLVKADVPPSDQLEEAA